MGRDSSIQVYLSEDRKEWLTDQAEAADQSRSEYCRQVITEHINEVQNEQQYRRYGVDQQIELVLDEIHDETMTLLSNFQSETGTTLERIQRVRTIYVIALWHLLESDYPLSERKAALKRASEYAGRHPGDDPVLSSVVPSGQANTDESGAEQTEATLADTTGGDSE